MKQSPQKKLGIPRPWRAITSTHRQYHCLHRKSGRTHEAASGASGLVQQGCRTQGQYMKRRGMRSLFSSNSQSWDGKRQEGSIEMPATGVGLPDRTGAPRTVHHRERWRTSFPSVEADRAQDRELVRNPGWGEPA